MRGRRGTADHVDREEGSRGGSSAGMVETFAVGDAGVATKLRAHLERTAKAPQFDVS